MSLSLADEFKRHHTLSLEGQEFLTQLEKTIGQDLWISAGGNWSSDSITFFRQKCMLKLAQKIQNNPSVAFSTAWSEVVRDFHSHQFWGEIRLLKKEKKPQTEESKIFWELFGYIFVLINAMLITKTVVFYYGLKSAQDESGEGLPYVLLALAFSFSSLCFFAYKKTKKKKD